MGGVWERVGWDRGSARSLCMLLAVRGVPNIYLGLKIHNINVISNLNPF